MKYTQFEIEEDAVDSTVHLLVEAVVVAEAVLVVEAVLVEAVFVVEADVVVGLILVTEDC